MFFFEFIRSYIFLCREIIFHLTSINGRLGIFSSFFIYILSVNYVNYIRTYILSNKYRKTALYYPHSEFLPEGQTVNKKYYLGAL